MSSSSVISNQFLYSNYSHGVLTISSIPYEGTKFKPKKGCLNIENVPVMHIFILYKLQFFVISIVNQKQGKLNSRYLELKIGDKKLATPTYFPSISTASTRMPYSSIIRTLVTSGFPKLLVSCYDLYKLRKEKEIFRYLGEHIETKNLLFLDSGEFERYWFESTDWSFDKYKKTVEKINSDLFGSYDIIPTQQYEFEDVVTHTIQKTEASFELINNNYCITIFHGDSPEELCKLINKVLSSHKEFFGMIAVAERECGKMIEDKIKTVQKIREILKQNSSNTILHVLGCGSPSSIALLTFAGADSFDSFDWNRWIIDKKTMQFHDFANLTLLDCNCKGCSSTNRDSRERAMLHNLFFYQDFVYRLQRSIIDNEDISLVLREYFDPKIVSKAANFF